MPTTAMNIGCIGLGRMGKPIARRLIDTSRELLIHDIKPETGEGLIDKGARWCDSPADLAAHCDVVVLSLPGPPEVNQVVLGPAGALRAARTGSIIVDTSTIGPRQSRDLFHNCEGAGVAYLDAPVSGGVEAAAAGALTVMVGGSRSALERARPALDCFSRQIFYLGPSGTGSTLKAVVQAIFLSQTAVLLEALSIGQHCGVSLQSLLEVIAASSAHHSFIAKRYGKILDQDWAPRFSIASAIKDLSVVQALCAQAECEAMIVGAAAAAYARAERAGLGDKDLIALLAMT
jgi:2-hydroxy-3-oxopropionate reductase